MRNKKFKKPKKAPQSMKALWRNQIPKKSTYVSAKFIPKVVVRKKESLTS